MNTPSPFVVSPDWLEKRLDDPHLSIIDGSWFLPAQGRVARAEYEAAHIPGAVFFDHDQIVDASSDLPHTVPSAEDFEKFASQLGVNANDKIVVYDAMGMFTAPRVWWMFRTMGSQEVYVLDGGFDNWKADGRPVSDAVVAPEIGTFRANQLDGQIVDFATMMGIVGSGKGQIADARSAGRFFGDEAEPREGMRSGHMPGAVNVPFSVLSENGYLKSVDQLKRTLADHGVDIAKPVVTTCGSGVTAAVINLALASIGQSDSRLYDGSWSEWGARSDTQVVNRR